MPTAFLSEKTKFIDFYDEFKGFRSMVWDEENRLRGINDNGRLHLYTYDHTGERALKSSAESSMAVINGLASAVITHTEDYTAYVSPYFVVQKGKFTKHFFEGATRVVSKLGEGTFSHKNTGIMAGGLDYLKRTQKEQEARDRYIKGLNVPPGPPTQHGIYTTPEWTGKEYPSIDWAEISQNTEPPAGWPRYPRFNEPGDVPGPPVQFGEPVTNANVKAGHGFIPNGVEEKNLYYYHPDHLGSSSYITDKEGQIIQHTEYMAFGEILVDEHSTTNKMPYLFNGKELDYETGLYYYGARYYDPKTSIFLNVDPLVEKTGTPYAYVNNNPVNLIDPTGMEAEDVDDIIIRGSDKKQWRIKTAGEDKIFNVPFALKKNATLDIGAENIDPNRFAVGYTIQGDIGAGLGVGGAGGVDISIVQFTDNKYSGYNYVYAGLHEQFSAGAQAMISGSFGGSVSIAYNDDTKPINPTSYAGSLFSVGISADVKFIGGGGININAFSGAARDEKGWKGFSLGISIGAGVGANLGSGNVTLSYTWLLNDVKPTSKRSFMDRTSNLISPISSAITTGTLEKIKQLKNNR